MNIFTQVKEGFFFLQKIDGISQINIYAHVISPAISNNNDA